MTAVPHVPTDPRPGDLRVWHIPQIPGTPFTYSVSTIQEGRHLLGVLAEYDLFQLEHNIKSDFSNAQGLERFEETGHNPGDPRFDWFEVDLDDDELEDLSDDRPASLTGVVTPPAPSS